MMPHARTSWTLQELFRRYQEWLDNPHRHDDREEMERVFGQLSQGFGEHAKVYAELAAWCRLGLGWVRGEDAPETIYTPQDEDPVDTARWQKWRVS
jgi:hypothetical protein